MKTVFISLILLYVSLASAEQVCQLVKKQKTNYRMLQFYKHNIIALDENLNTVLINSNGEKIKDLKGDYLKSNFILSEDLKTAYVRRDKEILSNSERIGTLLVYQTSRVESKFYKVDTETGLETEITDEESRLYFPGKYYLKNAKVMISAGEGKFIMGDPNDPNISSVLSLFKTSRPGVFIAQPSNKFVDSSGAEIKFKEFENYVIIGATGESITALPRKKYAAFQSGRFDSSDFHYFKFDESGNIKRLGQNEIENERVGAIPCSFTFYPQGAIKGLSPLCYDGFNFGMSLDQASLSSLYTFGQVCASEVDIEDCDCWNQNQNQDTYKMSLQDIRLKALCSADFDEKAWNELLPPKKNMISRDEAFMWLMRFQKPGGYNPEKHFGILNAIKRKMYSGGQNSDYNMLNVESLSYDPETKMLLDKSNFYDFKSKKKENYCLSDGEYSKLAQKEYPELLTEILKHEERFLGFLNEQDINHDFFNALNDAQREELADKLADKMVERAQSGAPYRRYNDDSQNRLKEIFPSKLYKFYHAKIMSAMTGKPSKLNDVTTIRSGQNIEVVRLSTSTFDHRLPPLRLALGIKTLAIVPKSNVSENQMLTYSYEDNGTKYRAEVEIAPVIDEQKRDYVDRSPGFNYNEMWKDKVLRGVILTNEVGGNGIWTIDSYISYYTRHGCVFDPSKKRDVNTMEYLQDRVNGKDQMDYFLKEAHSDGDENNLFRMSKKSTILTCLKDRGNGYREEVELVFPQNNEHDDTFLPNKTFASWFSDRIKNGGGQMAYINSSCNSYKKASNEIMGVAGENPVAASKLVNIASSSLVYFFRDFGRHKNEPFSAKQAILTGLRNGNSYSEIRQNMKQDSRYNSNLGNQFLFPDEERYSQHVRIDREIPVSVHVTTSRQNSNGEFQIYDLSSH